MKAILAFGLLAVTGSGFAQVKFTKSEGQVAVEIDGKPFTTFFIGPDTPKPYLHPLTTADGKAVTRMWPMAEKEGEARDQPANAVELPPVGAPVRSARCRRVGFRRRR